MTKGEKISAALRRRNQERRELLATALWAYEQQKEMLRWALDKLEELSADPNLTSAFKPALRRTALLRRVK